MAFYQHPEKKLLRGRGAQITTDNPFERQSYEAVAVDTGDGEEEHVPKTRYVQVHPRTIVNKVTSPDIPLSFSLNPYQGCEHGCVYCYARNSHEFWGYSAGLDFERFILLKENAPHLLEAKLLSKTWKVEPIVLSGNTDCYQPVERKLGITRELLKIFAKYRHPVGIITKNALVTRDLDILTDLAKDQLVKVCISVTGVDESLCQIMEPRTSSYAKRLRTIERLSAKGIPVSVMMAPVIPSINSDAIMAVAKATSNAGAMDLGYTTVRLNGRLSEVFDDWLRKHFPDRADRVMHQIASLHRGRVNDSRFGARMKGDGKLAEVIRQQFAIARKLYFSDRKLPEYNRESFRRNQLTLF